MSFSISDKDYLSIVHEEEMAFIEHCKEYVTKNPMKNKSYEHHFNYLYDSTRERRGFLYEYRLKSKFFNYYYKFTSFKGEAKVKQSGAATIRPNEEVVRGCAQLPQ